MNSINQIQLTLVMVFIICLVYSIIARRRRRQNTQGSIEDILADIQDTARENIVVKLKNLKMTPAEEWTYTQKISEDTSRANMKPDELKRRLRLKE